MTYAFQPQTHQHQLKPGTYEVLVFRNRSDDSPYLEWLDTLDWKMILLLAGGDKSSQNRDIKKAKEYWKIHLEDHP